MTLRLFSPWSPSVMRSLPWAARNPGDAAGHNPLNPDDAAFYRDGEWLEDDGNGNLQRGGANPLFSALGTQEVNWGAPHYQIFGERGRTDLAAMAGAGRGVGGKVTVIRIHAYEAETDIWGGTAADGEFLLGAAAAFAAGEPLVVGDIFTAAVGGQCLRGLLEPTAADIAAVPAVTDDSPVARVVSFNANTGFLRYLVR